MKLTKLVHACLIAEKDSKKILIDPGSYSWLSGVVSNEHLQGIDSVVITHAHPDHLHQDFVNEIAAASPNATWYGTPEIVDTLKSWGIDGQTESNDPDIKYIPSEHADLSPWFPSQPQHTSYVIFNELLIGGDCHTLTQSHGARIFGGAINGGPWGAVIGFAKMIESMNPRPEVVIPLHDWHLNDEARNGFYAKFPEVLGQFNVQFMPLENGVSKDL